MQITIDWAMCHTISPSSQPASFPAAQAPSHLPTRPPILRVSWFGHRKKHGACIPCGNSTDILWKKAHSPGTLCFFCYYRHFCSMHRLSDLCCPSRRWHEGWHPCPFRESPTVDLLPPPASGCSWARHTPEQSLSSSGVPVASRDAVGSDSDDSGNHSEITSNGFTTCFGTNLLLQPTSAVAADESFLASPFTDAADAKSFRSTLAVAAAPSKVCLHSTWLSDQELYKVVNQPVAGHPIGAGLC